MARKSTIALVAEHAGVSVASVSRVVNGLPASADVRERVQAAVEALGYVRDASARSLKAGRTEQIGFAVADLGNPVYVSMMREITDVVQAAGYRLVLSSTGGEPADQIAVLRGLDGGFVDGLILSPLRVTEELLEQLRRRRHPIVVIGSVPDDVAVDGVRADSATGMRLALEHLAALGRRRVALVNGPVDTVPGAARLSGYLMATQALRLPAHEDLRVAAADFTYAAGRVAAGALLQQASPDAVVCANDLLAAAVLAELGMRGLRVPEDVAVVGMDDTELAEIVRPALTSVDLGSVTRARRAAELLLDRLRDPELPVQRVVVAPRLRVRASSGAPR